MIPNSVTSLNSGAFDSWTSNNQPLVISNSVTSISSSTFSTWTSNNQLLVIPDSVTSIGHSAFREWSSNNQSLIIPNSVISIDGWAFSDWSSNNQPLVIPNSVTSIGERAFFEWSANTHPLIIPDSVTSIGRASFYGWLNVPYVEMQSTTPPTLAEVSHSPIKTMYQFMCQMPSVAAYKAATNWASPSISNRIFPVSDKYKKVTTVAGKTGAVVLAKTDVGLGSVQNYALASKTQAEAGTSNVLYMTPLRTKELITAVIGRYRKFIGGDII